MDAVVERHSASVFRSRRFPVISEALMKKRYVCAVLASMAVGSVALAADRHEKPKFSDFPVPLYVGAKHIPKYYKRTGDTWTDDEGKQVGSPTVNFAGRYHVGLHSCGAECRYYTLSDLATGRDSNALDGFWSRGDEPLKTKDGRAYLTDLISRPESAMIVAHYQIDESATAPAECRQRIFVLNKDGEAVTPITPTIHGCEAPQQ